MLDWDDVRYFLSLAREGSVRAAAERLKVNHSTVLRRIDAPWQNGGNAGGTAFFSNRTNGWLLRGCSGSRGIDVTTCQTSIAADGSASLKSLLLQGATTGYALAVQNTTRTPTTGQMKSNNLLLLDASGNLQVGASINTAGTVAGSSFIGALIADPINSTTAANGRRFACVVGQTFDSANYHYVCDTANHVKRVALRDF